MRSASIVLLAVTLAACGRAPAPQVEDWTVAPPDATVTLAAAVRFDAMRVHVENRGAETWTEVRIELRRDGSPRVFAFPADVILAQRTLPVGALHFEADDGRRMSPFEGAPAEWRVLATLPGGRRGWAAGRVEEVAPQ